MALHKLKELKTYENRMKTEIRDYSKLFVIIRVTKQPTGHMGFVAGAALEPEFVTAPVS